MVRKAESSKGLHKISKNGGVKVSQAKITATIAELEQVKPQSAKVAEAITLSKAWLSDESGYDEQVWPRLKKALEKERERIGARRLFDACCLTNPLDT
jgi:hypothetical protein